jgi:hypothetical protein
MVCPVTAVPKQLQFQWDRVAIHCERQEDADAFGTWLIEGEEKAQSPLYHEQVDSLQVRCDGRGAMRIRRDDLLDLIQGCRIEKHEGQARSDERWKPVK